MRNHTTGKLWELSGPQGKNPTVTPGAGATDVQFLLNSLPTAKDNKFWYYLTGMWIKVLATITVPTDTTFTGLQPDYLWQIVQSLQVQCPILGQLFQHSNTRGAVLGNIIQYLGYGYNATPINKTVCIGGGTADVCLYIRVPFSYEFLRKPHETSPWLGFLEGGTVDVKVAPQNALAYIHANTTIDEVTIRCACEVIPSPEAVIHTPVHWREHRTPGGSTKHVITDMGSPDGLQGIDQSKGVGLAALMELCGVTDPMAFLGLGGSQVFSNILAYDIPFRDQTRIDYPEFPYLSLITMMGNNRRPIHVDSAGLLAPAAVSDNTGFPWPTFAPAVDGVSVQFSTYAMVNPLVLAGRDTETSKLQTVAGAKEMNFQYTSTPNGQSVWGGLYFPVFDEQFAKSLAARIAPGSSGELVAKTLNKQTGGTPGVGKLAYTRQKVK